jgi:hypothetical protein
VTRIRAVVLLFIVVIGTAVALLPALRDDLSWWWADSHDHAVDFMTYLDAWPNGRHAADARLKYRQRQWMETKQAMIHEAYQEATHASPEADAQYLKEKRKREDAFFWKAASSTDTVESYRDYLKDFPRGKYTNQALARITALNQGSQAAPPANLVPPQ